MYATDPQVKHLDKKMKKWREIFLVQQTQIHKLKSDVKYYVWYDPYLCKFDSDQVIRRCVLDYEIESVLHLSHVFQVGGTLVLKRLQEKS